jgi:BASS family bile acid:Na+ symporter
MASQFYSMHALVLSVLKAGIFLTVLTLGFRAKFSDAAYMLWRPGDFGRVFLSMNVLMPLTALTLVLWFNLDPAVKIALATLSVSPVPPLFPKKSVRGHGRGDYSVGLLVAAAMPAIVVMPFTLKIFAPITDVPLHLPTRSVATLVLAFIVAPLLIGLSARRVVPSFAERAARPVGALAAVLLGLAILPVLFVSGKAMVSLIGNGTLLSMTAFALMGLLWGYLLGGPDLETKRALALATACRHPGVAIAIADENFPQQRLVVPAVGLYLIVITLLWAVVSWRRLRQGTGPAANEAHEQAIGGSQVS